MSIPIEFEKAHAPKDVDSSAAGRGVWLVKVPKYISEQWKSMTPGSDVGKLKISKSKIPNKKPDIVFSTTNNIPDKKPTLPGPSSSSLVPSNALAMVPLGKPQRPPPSGNQDHKFLVTNVGTQKLIVMSHVKAGSNSTDPQADKINIEGKVVQKAEVHPSIRDAAYRALKREQVTAQNTPRRQMELLQAHGQTYKPIKEHQIVYDDRRTKKTEKRSRAEKDKVLDILFNAFEKHQFYTIKDLMGISKQPMPYLKEILREICNYNNTAPHKNMWELKPEFRHYKTKDEAADT